MFRPTLAAPAMIALCLVLPTMAQEVTEYLGVPGPITLGDTEYALSWSSNPSPGYFKQEYLPASAVPETYGSMVMVEFFATDLKLSEVVSAQMAMIEERKATDPVANMAIFANDETGEIVLDFLLSTKDEKGEFILEWNGYLYSDGELEGQPGSVLLAISERAYGNKASEAFLKGLRDYKEQRILALTRVDLPDFR